MSQRADGNFVSLILIGIAAVTTIYWASVFKKMLKMSSQNILQEKQKPRIGFMILLRVKTNLFL